MIWSLYNSNSGAVFCMGEVDKDTGTLIYTGQCTGSGYSMSVIKIREGFGAIFARAG